MEEDVSDLDLDDLWSRMLSRQPDLIRECFSHLSAEEQVAVRLHLQRMSDEPGWHPEQRISAQAALLAIEE